MVLGLGVGASLVAAAVDEREIAFTLGVAPIEAIAVAAPGEEVCQVGVDVPAAFEAVRAAVDPALSPAGPVTVVVRDQASRERLASGRLTAGDSDGGPVAKVGRVEAGRRVDVCFNNRGGSAVGLMGHVDAAAPETTVQPPAGLPADLTLDFLRDEPVSLLSLAPEVFERASLWRPGWVGPWLFWALAALVLLGAPLLALRALSTAARPDGDGTATQDGPAG